MKNIKEYTPGFNIDDVKKKYKIKKVVKLASNENPFVSDKVKQLLKSSNNEINLYPKSHPIGLQKLIAKKVGYDIKENNILMGNGSNEILEFIARAKLDKNSEAIIPKHSFLVYEIISKLQGAKIINTSPCLEKKNLNYLGVDVESIINKISTRTKLIFIANPANPTGTYIKLSEIKYLLNNISKKITVVVDEAYFEYLDNKTKSAVSLIKKYSNLFVTRSFSKIYGLAALRIGYGISQTKNILGLKVFKQPFNTNALAQSAALLAMKDKKFFVESKKNNNIQINKLVLCFRKLSINYLGLYCNFITFKSGKSTKELFDYLIKNGVIIRPLDNYKLPEYLRVSIGNSKDVNLFIKHLTKFYEQKI